VVITRQSERAIFLIKKGLIMEINISAKNFRIKLFIIVAVLISIHIVLKILEFGFGHDIILGLIPFLRVTSEGIIPTMYSTVALLAASSLFGLISIACTQAKRIFALSWASLSAIFLFLAMDEALMIHEMLNIKLTGSFDTSGINDQAWIIPYGIGVIILGVIYIKFLRSLPRRTCRLMVSAACIFLTGAIGMEILGEIIGDNAIIGNIISTVEETFEMSGIVILIYALLEYIAVEFEDLRIKFIK